MIQPRFALGRRARHVAGAMTALGTAAIVAGLAWDPARTWPGLLVNGFYTLAIALGGVVFLALRYLSGAAWSAVIRRMPEAMIATLPVRAILKRGRLSR